MTKFLALIFVLIGATLIAASITSRAASPDEITRQRRRFEALEAVPPLPPSSASASPTEPYRTPLSRAQPDDPKSPLEAQAPEPAAMRDQLTGMSGSGGFDPGQVIGERLVLSGELHQVAAKPALAPPPPDMPSATHITIPAVGVDTDIVEVVAHVQVIDGQRVRVWQVADWVAGHHMTSADPGEGGNIVLAGHDDYRGEVFRGLHDIAIGDQIRLTSPAGEFAYTVQEVHVRRIEDEPLSVLLAVGQFMAPMPEERLTLITCWPYGIDNHRIIVVARPSPPTSP